MAAGRLVSLVAQDPVGGARVGETGCAFDCDESAAPRAPWLHTIARTAFCDRYSLAAHREYFSHSLSAAMGCAGLDPCVVALILRLLDAQTRTLDPGSLGVA